MEKLAKLHPGRKYRIEHQGNAGGTIFFESANKSYFLLLLQKHLGELGVISNIELHKCKLSFDIKFFEEIKLPAQYRHKLYLPLSNLFNSYSKSINKRFDRQGSLFKTRFDRVEIE